MWSRSRSQAQVSGGLQGKHRRRAVPWRSSLRQRSPRLCLMAPKCMYAELRQRCLLSTCAIGCQQLMSAAHKGRQLAPLGSSSREHHGEGAWLAGMHRTGTIQSGR